MIENKLRRAIWYPFSIVCIMKDVLTLNKGLWVMVWGETKNDD